MSETRAASTNAAEIDNSENIILGSGDLYIVEFNDAVPEDATIEIDDNRAGNIKGGATLEYTATSQTVKDYIDSTYDGAVVAIF